MFKSQILAKLVLKYPGLPKAFLGTLAEKAKVTEESQIEGFISGLETLPISVEDLAAEFQKEGDRRATEGVEAYKKKNPAPPDPNNPNPDPKKDNPPAPPAPGETELEKKFRLMEEKIAKMESDKTLGTLREQLNAKLAEKKIPAILAKHVVLTPETDLDALVTGFEADHKELMQNTVTTKIKANAFNPGGAGGAGGGADDKKVASKEETKALLDRI